MVIIVILIMHGMTESLKLFWFIFNCRFFPVHRSATRTNDSTVGIFLPGVNFYSTVLAPHSKSLLSNELMIDNIIIPFFHSKYNG